jgi:hypothetical protein
LELKARSQRFEIINFAIEYQAVARIRIKHRLMASGRKVEDRESSKAKTKQRARFISAERQLVIALVIRAAVNHRLHHAADGRFDFVAICTDDAANAAHGDGVASSRRDRGVKQIPRPLA